jgi:hypothetical protein
MPLMKRAQFATASVSWIEKSESDLREGLGAMLVEMLILMRLLSTTFPKGLKLL